MSLDIVYMSVCLITADGTEDRLNNRGGFAWLYHTGGFDSFDDKSFITSYFIKPAKKLYKLLFIISCTLCS